MSNDMKKFLSKVFLMIAILSSPFIVCFALGVFVIGNQYQDNYQASLIDKVARLKSINEPKIILVGNSSLAFGMNSPMLQEAMNMPVVNLGLHAGLGNAFHEDIAKLNINSGDIVIVCHSNFRVRDGIGEPLLAWITIEYNWDLWPILRARDYLAMIRAYPVYWIKALWKWLPINAETPQEATAYARSSLNEYGDIVFKPALEKPLERPKTLKVPTISDGFIRGVNELNKYVTERGATLLMAGYPIMTGELSPTKEEYESFEKFQRELASRLDCEVISNYTDYFIPYEYFYDFTTHLNNEGAKIRTQQLIKDIQNWQKKTGNH